MADGGGTSCNDAAAVDDAAALLDTTSIGIVITISAGNIMCLSELPYNKFWSCFLCHIYTLDYAVTGCSGEIAQRENAIFVRPDHRREMESSSLVVTSGLGGFIRTREQSFFLP